MPQVVGGKVDFMALLRLCVGVALHARIVHLQSHQALEKAVTSVLSQMLTAQQTLFGFANTVRSNAVH